MRLAPSKIAKEYGDVSIYPGRHGHGECHLVWIDVGDVTMQIWPVTEFDVAYVLSD